MTPAHLAEIEAVLERERDAGGDIGSVLVHACVDVLDVSGAGIMLMLDGEHGSALGSSNATSALIEELQFTLGEGPCVDAVATMRNVYEADLQNPDELRWPAFSGPAIDAGVRAIFGIPVLTGSTCLGALDLFCDRPRDLDRTQRTDAVQMAALISRVVMGIQANTAPGTIAEPFATSIDHRSVVHQASGMVSAQLDIPVADALARVRAHAYAEGRPVNDVARDIVRRQLHLDIGPKP
jgi:transcriptional regulator with GAF, ATPase, and Fis domain